MRIAITRKVSPAMAQCELTHVARSPVDVPRAADQHRRYEDCLRSLGCEVKTLPEEPDLPDSVFVEDAAVVLDEIAVITRPGAESRRAETESIAQALAPYRKLLRMDAPGTLDGGDVLRLGRTLYVGNTSRSNREGIAQLAKLAAPHGYNVLSVEVTGCLHLKTAVTEVGESTLLINPRMVDRRIFGALEFVEVDPAEPHAGNALLLDGTVVYPAAHQKTLRRLEERGIKVAALDVSEVLKAEGGVTCCSLVFEVSGKS
ncbi:MAG: arginine deiminase-related protein [Acidobacteria bacterium]|nr:arginine deiminase-related protein [Acidobacteriota bacterium]